MRFKPIVSVLIKGASRSYKGMSENLLFESKKGLTRDLRNTHAWLVSCCVHLLGRTAGLGSD